MAVIHLAATLRTALVELVDNAIDAGSAGGKIKIYTASMPSTPETAISSQTLLATCTFASTSKSSESAGVLTFASITNGTAVATGTAAWARITDSDDNVVCDVDVTVSAGTGMIKLNTLSIVSGDTVSINSGATVTMPAS